MLSIQRTSRPRGRRVGPEAVEPAKKPGGDVAASLLSASRHLALNASLVFAFLDVVSLFEFELGACEGQPYFYVAALEVHSHGHDCQPLFGDDLVEPVDLATVHEQLSRAGRLVVEIAAGVVLGDIRPYEKQFSATNARVAFLQAHLSMPDAFYLGAFQRDAGLEFLEELEFVPRLFVSGYGLDSAFFSHMYIIPQKLGFCKFYAGIRMSCTCLRCWVGCRNAELERMVGWARPGPEFAGLTERDAGRPDAPGLKYHTPQTVLGWGKNALKCRREPDDSIALPENG